MIVDAWGATTLFDLVFFLVSGVALCSVRGWQKVVRAWGATTLFAFFYIVGAEAFWSVGGIRTVVEAWGTTTLLALVFCVPRRQLSIRVEPSPARRKQREVTTRPRDIT